MSNQADIAITYDVSNEFYPLWLDRRSVYSCALFEGTEDLEEAQVRKLRWICEAADVAPGKRVLDIGCGWGSALRFMRDDLGVVDVTGLTLSRAQYEAIQRKPIPGADIVCASYLGYEPQHPFDAAISIGMFEHVASPADRDSGQQVEVYRHFFQRVWDWTVDGARFGLQTIYELGLPRNRRDLEDLAFMRDVIFPGAMMPRLETIFAAMNPYWRVVEFHDRREHYAQTTAEWRRRLRARRHIVRDRFGEGRFEEYDRYLGHASRAFESGYYALAQLALVRNELPASTARPTGSRNHNL